LRLLAGWRPLVPRYRSGPSRLRQVVELTSPVKDCRFSSLAARTFASRTRTQTPGFRQRQGAPLFRNQQGLRAKCNL